MIKLMFICNDADMARHAEACGVDRIFVDLEQHGKWERQGHRDTVISTHSVGDVVAVREVLKESELLVRVNPLYEGSVTEIENVIAAGADILMLPMFETAADVAKFVALVNGRATVIPLVETLSAMVNIAEIVAVPGVDEIYIGLNDLHMALGMDFMFELLADGSVEHIATICHAAGIPFGFGGVARMDEGLLPGKLVLAEHLRLGSSAVILSRTFHRASTTFDEMRANVDFQHEIELLRDYELHLTQRDVEKIEADHNQLLIDVAAVSVEISGRRKSEASL